MENNTRGAAGNTSFRRSALAAATLRRLGFTGVKYLAPGFRAWAEGGHSIYSSHGELTVTVFEKSEE